MNQTHTYNVKVSWLESRKGILASDVLNEKIEVATPPEFTKGIAGVWSPEHLFVASASSCFMTTFLAIAEKSRLEFSGFDCDASGTLETIEGQMMISNIVLHPKVTLVNNTDFAKCIKVLETAHHACLILHSMKTQIHFMPQVIIGEQNSKTITQTN